MKHQTNDLAVSALRRAVTDLEKSIRKLAEEASVLHQKYRAKMDEASGLRMKLTHLKSSIYALTGEAPPAQGITEYIEILLAGRALTLAEIKTQVTAAGFTASAVRKALNGIAFSEAPRQPGDESKRYMLREAMYADRDKQVLEQEVG